MVEFEHGVKNPTIGVKNIKQLGRLRDLAKTGKEETNDKCVRCGNQTYYRIDNLLFCGLCTEVYRDDDPN